MQDSSTVVAILGMHRSGTSTLAGSLEAHGLFMGDVVRSAPYNRRGNVEHLGIRALHDSVLGDNGGTWDAPPSTSAWSNERLEQLASIVQLFAGHRMWGFKDPRTLLVLHGWITVLPRLLLVGTFRHPVSVVSSLRARNPSIDREHALQLWVTYNRLLLACVAEHRARIVCFDVSAEQYLEDVARLSASIGLSPRAPAPFYAPDLRHWADASWSGVPRAARLLYEDLSAAAS